MRISDPQRRHLLFLLQRDVAGAALPQNTAAALTKRGWIRDKPGRAGEGKFVLTLHGRNVAKKLKKETMPHATKGFASMPPEKRREVAAKGGAAVAPQNRAFVTQKGLAAKAGKTGGVNVPPEKRSFSKDKALASRAGKVGGKAKRK